MLSIIDGETETKPALFCRRWPPTVGREADVGIGIPRVRPYGGCGEWKPEVDDATERPVDHVPMTIARLDSITDREAQWCAVASEIAGKVITTPHDLLRRWRWTCGVRKIVEKTPTPDRQTSNFTCPTCGDLEDDVVKAIEGGPEYFCWRCYCTWINRNVPKVTPIVPE